ncbi:MAG: hypothetical protein NTX22_16990 [Ignavibacteriales bacterium]|nr:hypothetical protein [Ignavibacteriales bacterium]
MEKLNYNEIVNSLYSFCPQMEIVLKDISSKINNENIELIDRVFLKTVFEIVEMTREALQHKMETAIEVGQMTTEEKIKYLINV